MEVETKRVTPRNAPNSGDTTDLQTISNKITDRLSDPRQIPSFNSQLRRHHSKEDRLLDMQVLLDSPTHIIQKFMVSGGMRTLGDWVYDGTSSLSYNSEVLQRIFKLLLMHNLRNEHLDAAHSLALGIEKLQNVQRDDQNDEVFNTFYKFYNLNKQVVNEWLEDYYKKQSDPNFKRQVYNKPSYTSSKDESQNNSKSSSYNQEIRYKKYNHSSRPDSPPAIKKPRFNNETTTTSTSRTYEGASMTYHTKDYRPSGGKKQVIFSNENQTRRFRKEDEPTAGDMTDAEVEKYYTECMNLKQQTRVMNMQDLRHRENQLEKESRNQVKESEKKEREMLDAMRASITWRMPYKLKGVPAEYVKNMSSESQEKDLHSNRILCKIQSLYNSDSEIPNQPSYDNILNDAIAEKDPQQIFLNKLGEDDFVQLMEMAMKKDGQEMRKKVEKKAPKSILKKSKEEREKQRKKMLEDKRKSVEEEERLKKNINLAQLETFIKDHRNSSREQMIDAVKRIGISEKEMQNIFQNYSLIQKIQQRTADSASSATTSASGATQTPSFSGASSSSTAAKPPADTITILPQTGRPPVSANLPLNPYTPPPIYNQPPPRVNQPPYNNGAPHPPYPPYPPHSNMMPPKQAPYSYQPPPGVIGIPPPKQQLQQQPLSQPPPPPPPQQQQQQQQQLQQQQQQPPYNPYTQPPQSGQDYPAQPQQGQQPSYYPPQNGEFSMRTPPLPGNHRFPPPPHPISSQRAGENYGRPPISPSMPYGFQNRNGLGNQDRYANKPFPRNDSGEQQQQWDERSSAPCRLYHSEQGCKRNICHFKHIPEYQGKPAPNMTRPLVRTTDRNSDNPDYSRNGKKPSEGGMNGIIHNFNPPSQIPQPPMYEGHYQNRLPPSSNNNNTPSTPLGYQQQPQQQQFQMNINPSFVSKLPPHQPSQIR